MPERRFAAVACGSTTVFAVTEEGSTYACGYGDFGSLGFGDTEHVRAPRLIPGLADVKVVGVSASVWHTAHTPPAPGEGSSRSGGARGSLRRLHFTASGNASGQLPSS